MTNSNATNSRGGVDMMLGIFTHINKNATISCSFQIYSRLCLSACSMQDTNKHKYSYMQ